MRYLLSFVVLGILAEEAQAFGSIQVVPTTTRRRTLLSVASSNKKVLKNPSQEQQQQQIVERNDQTIADAVLVTLEADAAAAIATSAKVEEIVVDSAAAPEGGELDLDDDDDDDDLVILDGEDNETSFLTRTKLLCQQRNFPLEKVKNARDLASTPNSPLRPGRLYRMGRLSDATVPDIQLLFQDLNLKTLVDLRSPTELKEDKTLLRQEVFGNFTNVVWMERGRGKEGCIKVLEPGQLPVKTKVRVANKKEGVRRNFWRRNFGRSKQEKDVVAQLETKGEDDDDDDDDDELDDEDDVTLNILPEEECGIDDCPEPVLPAQGMERHFVSLMNEFKYVRGTLFKVRKRDIARSLLKSPGALVSRRVRSSCKKPFIKEINDGGLPMLNELLLRFGAPGIKYVLELCADADRHPVAFYCTAGKDRTGMIAAIIMGLCGVTAKDIVEDYTLSANVYAEMNDHSAMVGALSQRNLDPKTFLGAPPHVMRDTLATIRAEYGSVEGYCTWIGFGPEKQEKLRTALLLPK